jgi:ATP-dependent helicase/DNAse subunit B
MKDDQSSGIKLFHVPLNNRGSTEHLLKRSISHIKWPDFSGIMYISPSPRKIRDAQKIFHTLVESPYIPPRFFTLNQLAKNLFDIEIPGKVLPHILVPLLISEISGHSIGYSRILSDLLKELKQHHPSKDINLIQQEIRHIFKKLGLPEDTLKRLNDTLDIFKKYQKFLSDHNYCDEDDILNLNQSAAAGIVDKITVLIADGFYDMTTSERNLFGKMIKKAETALISVPYNDKLSFISRPYIDYLKLSFDVIEERFPPASEPDLSFVTYSSMEEEIEGIARHIKNHFKAGSLTGDKWTIVTFPRIINYKETTERVFTRYGIPFTASLQKPAIRNSPLRDFIYLLESVIEDFPRQKFTTVLHSSHFNILSDHLRKQIPSLSLSSGIIKGIDSWKNLGTIIKDAILSKTIKHEITEIFNILNNLINIRSSAHHDIFYAEIKKVLSKLRFDAEQSDIDLLDIALQKNSMISVLSGKNNISLKRYTDSLKYILSSSEYRQEEQGIQIMDFFETRGLEPDYLYFCGLKDGDMPAKPPVDHILPDSVRTEYGLVNLQTYLSVQKLNFLRIISSSRNAHLSFPAMDGDRLFLPSPYLPWVKVNLHNEDVVGIFSREELQTMQGKRLFSDSIHEVKPDTKTKQKILSNEFSSPFRVTDIDYFRKCPRRFFIEKILKLDASEIVEYEVDAKLLGTVIHRVMEELLKEPLENTVSMSKRASSVIDIIMVDYHIDSHLKNLIKDSFLEIVPDIFAIESEMRVEGFFPYKLEMNLTGEVLPGTVLKGKIDRIDRKQELFRIMDYKTGTMQIGSEIITKGKELQIPLYAAMLISHGFKVEKAGVYSLKDIRVKWIPTKKDKNVLDDYITSALSYLEETVPKIMDAHFDASPMEEFYCSGCSEAPFCPYIHRKGNRHDG